MSSYIFNKVLLFIPVFWFSFIFETDLSALLFIRIISFAFCLLLLRLLSQTIFYKSVYFLDFEFNPKRHNSNENIHSRIKDELPRGLSFVEKVKSILYFPVELGEVILTQDIMRRQTIILIIAGLLFSTPFINNYTGVRDHQESFRGNAVSGNYNALFENKEYDNYNDSGKFDELESVYTRKFIFKESGIMSGYYLHDYDYFNIYNVLKLFLLPLLEACIKSIIWVPAYYLICSYFFKKGLIKDNLKHQMQGSIENNKKNIRL